jgi:hypothetical protein
LTANAALAGEMSGSYYIRHANKTVLITQAWCARAGTDDAWKAIDIDAIAPGEAAGFNFKGETCAYDVKIRFSDGCEQLFNYVDLCSGVVLRGT